MITHTHLGISEELFDYCKDKVIKIKQVHKVAGRRVSGIVKERLPHPKIAGRFISVQKVVEGIKLSHAQYNELFGVGLLNFVVMRTKEGYTYEGVTNGRHVFTKGERSFIVDTNGCLVYDLGNDTETTFAIKKTNTTTKEVTWLTRDVTEGEMAVECNIPLETANVIIDSALSDWNGVNTNVTKEGWIWEGSTVESDKHLAYAFSYLSKNENVITGGLEINGKDWKEFKPFGSIVFPFGKSGQDFCVDWVLYNEHYDETPDWSSEGNFGEAARVRIEDKNDPRAFSINVEVTEGEPYYDEDTHTFYYNEGKKALVSIAPTLLPAQGKNDDYECVIDLSTGTIYYSRFAALSSTVEVAQKNVEVVNTTKKTTKKKSAK